MELGLIHWFCDDSNLIANSVEAARSNIRVVRKVGREFGLVIWYIGKVSKIVT